MEEVDWNADKWFATCHARNLSDEFKEWWIGFYGRPPPLDDDGEHHEYWKRCAFAWLGWGGRGRRR